MVGHSNLGDAILASPVIEQVHRRFPDAELTLIIGQRARVLFAGDPRVRRVIEMESFGEGLGRLRLAWFVWSLRPQLLVDLRNTILVLVWRPWRILRYVWPVPRRVRHMRQRHLWRMERQLRPLLSRLPDQAAGDAGTPSIWVDPKATAYVDRQVSRWGLHREKRLVVIAPGARGSTRRWYPDRYAVLADRLIEEADAEVVFTGEPSDSEMVDEIVGGMRHRAHTIVGLTTIAQLAALMQRARLVIAQDSGSLQLAGAVRAPILALFGPSDPSKFGPTGAGDRVIQRKLFCVPCEVSLCRFNHECMRFITPDEVFDVAKTILHKGRR